MQDWPFTTLVPSANHVITRAVCWVEDDMGAPELWGRIRCQGCRRTQLVPLRHGCTYVGADFLLDAAARLLHGCGCGGKGVTYTDA